MYRKMRRAKQEISGEDCRRVLEASRFGTLALSLEDGMPYAVPVSYVFDEADGAIYFHGAGEGQKADAVRHDPRACFNVVSDPQQPEGQWWREFDSVTVFGTLHPVEDLQEKQKWLRRIGQRYYQDYEAVEAEIRQTLSRVLVLKLVPEHMTGKHVRER
ncbi:MAG: pyridoxamine 5'-phosphate oxidase family protein [Lachnospiraceae bacterium]